MVFEAIQGSLAREASAFSDANTQNIPSRYFWILMIKPKCQGLIFNLTSMSANQYIIVNDACYEARKASNKFYFFVLEGFKK